MNRFYFIIIIFTLLSCSKENTEPYFRLDNVGDLLLSGVKVNDTIIFSGSNGSKRVYKVSLVEKKKETIQECSWTWGNCKIFYHYDHLKIYYLRTDSIPPPLSYPLSYSVNVVMQLSNQIDKEKITKNAQAKATVHGNAFIDYNAIPPQGNVQTPYIVFPDFYAPHTLTTYSNAVKTYTDVIVIKSGNNNVYVDYFKNTYTVNQVWFDKKYGFVFFKDVFGNTWSRTN